MNQVEKAAPLLRPYITTKGLEAAVQASGLGKQVKIVKVGITSAPGIASPDDTALPGAQMLNVADGRLVNSHQINISTLLPDTFPSIDIAGIAFYLEDGTMFAIYREEAAFLEHTGGTTLLVGMDLVMDNIPSESVIVESTGANLILGDWVPVERRVNGKKLTEDVILTPEDVKAVAATGGFYIGRFEFRRPQGTEGFPNAVNSDGNNFINRAGIVHVAGNNGLHIFGDNKENARRMGIQSGHATGSYASSPGILELNPFGGEVRVNGYKPYTPGNKPSPADIGAVPTTRKVNNKALSEDITLTASDLGAATSDHGHSNLVPNTRKVNDKPLTADITLTAADVRAVPVDAAGKLTGPLIAGSRATTEENPNDHGFHVFNDRFGMNMLNHKDSVGSSADVWGLNLFTDSVTQRYVTFSAKKTEGEGKPSDFTVRARINTQTGEMYLKDGTKQVYHQGFNPTAEAVGALSINNGGISKAPIGVKQGAETEVKLLAGTTSGMMMYDGNGAAQWFSYYEASQSQYRIAEYTNGAYVGARFTIGKGGTATIDGTANAVLNLNTSNNAGAYILGRKGGVNDWYVGRGNTTGDIALSSYTHGTSLVIKSDRAEFNKPCYIQGNKALTEGDQHLWKNRGSKSNLNDAASVLPGYFSFVPGVTGSPNSAQYGHGFAINPGSNGANGVWSSQFAIDHNGKIWHRMGVNAPATSAWNQIYTSKDKQPITAREANADIVAGSHNVVGAYVFGWQSGATVGYGGNISGSILSPCSGSGRMNDSLKLSGTWKCMGHSHAGNHDERPTLWIRIA